MLCAQHPSTPAVAPCSRCDRGVCASCQQQRSGKMFCPSCAEFLDRRAAERGAPSGGPPARQSAAAAPQSATWGPPPVPSRGTPPPLPPLPATSGTLYEGPPAEASGAGAPSPAFTPPAPPAAAGDLYQGPADGLYQGPPAGAAGPGPGSIGLPRPGSGGKPGASKQGNLGRCLAFTIGAGILSAGVWYGIAAATGYKVGFVALIMGTGVGIAAVAGAGGGGAAVAAISLVVSALSMLAGDYLIVRHYYDQMLGEIQAEAALQVDYLADGRLSNTELAELEEMTPEELADIPPDELEDVRQAWVDELRANQSGGDDPPFAFGAFWLALTGIKDIIFYVLGLGAALKVPMGKG